MDVTCFCFLFCVAHLSCVSSGDSVDERFMLHLNAVYIHSSRYGSSLLLCLFAVAFFLHANKCEFNWDVFFLRQLGKLGTKIAFANSSPNSCDLLRYSYGFTFKFLFMGTFLSYVKFTFT